MALLGWLCSVEGVTLDWIGDRAPARDMVRELPARLLGGTLWGIEQFEPDCPAPARA
ncbi:hypothetical protein [Streptomyces sp. NPDC055134]